MTSGIKPSEECLDVFNRIKMQHTNMYAIFRVESEAIVVDKLSDSGAKYEDFLEDMQRRANTGCFAVIDFPYKRGMSTDSKLVFVSWVNDQLPTRTKMLYASSKESLKKKLEGIKLFLHSECGSISPTCKPCGTGPIFHWIVDLYRRCVCQFHRSVSQARHCRPSFGSTVTVMVLALVSSPPSNAILCQTNMRMLMEFEDLTSAPSRLYLRQQLCWCFVCLCCQVRFGVTHRKTVVTFC
ncbi:hypothetical protein CRM22_004658 [Opisthorchis felineus]|uniref:ADF-H domain-containing protein n=1 Tax=Opisthorchis felineus TaxID=147828 RepID=A0A4S2LW36_OPIFE|nr:hypothetical protein CRM22_004658 [Opisthorchis felineus]